MIIPQILFNTNLKKSILESYGHFSFDIFDTIIERKCISPYSIFYDVGLKNLGEKEADTFVRERILAERIAREISQSHEVTLQDIYKIINNKYDKKKLMYSEIEAELTNAIARTSICRMAEKLKEAGKQIYFISDMYLSSEIISDILDKNQINVCNRLYVSNVYKKSKADGGLFKILLEQNGITPKEILHFGDSYYSDIIGARRCDIDSRMILKNKMFERYRLARKYRV